MGCQPSKHPSPPKHMSSCERMRVANQKKMEKLRAANLKDVEKNIKAGNHAMGHDKDYMRHAVTPGSPEWIIRERNHKTEASNAFALTAAAACCI